MAKLSQRRTSKKQKVLQRPNPFVSETFAFLGLLAGAPVLETDVTKAKKGGAKPPLFCLATRALKLQKNADEPN
jgi:hypothetical protein